MVHEVTAISVVNSTIIVQMVMSAHGFIAMKSGVSQCKNHWLDGSIKGQIQRDVLLDTVSGRFFAQEP